MDYKIFLIRLFSSTIILFLFFLFIIFFENLLFLLVAVLYILIIYEIFTSFIKYNLSIFLYILISFIFSQYYFFYKYDQIAFFYFLVVIISFDTFSYIIGSFFGKKKILPNISPKKTYLGFFGGYFFTMVNILVFNKFLFYFTSLTKLILLTSLIIFFAFLGDIIQSIFKRQSNIKDSSNIIPGHGGIFDRLDGYILSILILVFI
jgi:phosphatidate cytidylyltransferase